MNFDEYIKRNLIKKTKPDFKQIRVQLSRAEKDLETAEKVKAIDKTWAYTICYHSMIRASRALMFSFGYLPTNINTHKTLIDFVKKVLGDKYSVLIEKFNRMRRTRHEFIYESKNGISAEQVDNSISDAKLMTAEIEKLIEKNNPQGKL